MESAMSGNRHGGTGGPLLALGAVGLAVACCAAPALIAAGGLAVVGGVLGSWWVLAVGGLLVAAAVVYTVVRARHRSAARSEVVDSADRESVGEQTSPVMVDDCCAVPRKRAVARPGKERLPLGDRAGRA